MAGVAVVLHYGLYGTKFHSLIYRDNFG